MIRTNVKALITPAVPKAVTSARYEKTHFSCRTGLAKKEKLERQHWHQAVMYARRFALSFWLALIALAFPSLASAHAILLSSTPSAKAVVHGSYVKVQLRFNSRIDAKRSRLILVTPGGAQNILTVSEQSSPDSLNTQVKGLNSGAFVLRWQVLASDGHITRGEIPFRVQ